MQITNIKEQIIQEIKDFVAAENRSCGLSDPTEVIGSSMRSDPTEGISSSMISDPTRDACPRSDAGSSSPGLWQEPLVGFADTAHPYIRDLRKIVHPRHQMPEEVIPNASIIVAYFVPFREWLPQTNQNTGLASPEWAQSYELTNAMFRRLNEHIIETVHKLGYEAATAPEAGVFYRDEVMSRWSFRHIAYAAGLGTFGLNNMLITEKGCAGRFNAVVTSLPADRVTPGEPKKQEACLYKRIGACRLCMKKCPVQALETDAFDREKCYGQCLENAAVYNTFGSSYTSAAGEEPDAGSEVCGKCLSGLPCTYKIP